MKYGLAKALAAIAGFCLIFGLLAHVICTQSVTRGFYYSEYKKLGVAEDIGVSEEDLKAATDVLLDYTEGKREDLLVFADFDGESLSFYNARESQHMADVRDLFLGARTVGYIGLAFGIAVLALLLIFYKDRRAVYSGYILANWFFLAVFAVLAVYAAIDFTSFWTSFHHVFFSNDLWLLDPRTDNLILMVPEQFFFDLVFRIVALFVSVAAALGIISAVRLGMLKKKRKAA